MRKHSQLSVAVLAALLGIWLAFSQRATKPTSPARVQGRNNTVLFITSNEHGLSNAHLATSFALLERHPAVEVHYASSPDVADRVHRISAAALTTTPRARPVQFHAIPGPSFRQAIMAGGSTMDSVVTAPGLGGIDTLATGVQHMLCPWTAEEHYNMSLAIEAIIEEVDPAVVVLDMCFMPGIDATRTANRLHAFVTPNVASDTFGGEQPLAKGFWKYPALSSGFPFPVPWRLIPQNIYLVLRLAYAVIFMPGVKEKREFLKSKGIVDPLNFLGLHQPDTPWICASMEGASLPLDVLPRNVTCVGPIVKPTTSAAQQDPELFAWISKRPTVLILLGSTVVYNQHRATVMAQAAKTVLDQLDVQVLWKFRKDGTYGDEFKEILRDHLDSGRARIENWLKVDPPALLESGHIAAFVHHGGGNCYSEGIAAGVPQVVLPLWVDLYNYAQLVEHIEVGVWASRRSGPNWTVEELSSAMLKVLDGKPTSVAIRRNARRLGDLAPRGRDAAADLVAGLAASGRDTFSGKQGRVEA